MNYSNNASAAYKEMAVTTSNQTHLVVMLYDGAINFLLKAIKAVENNDIPGKAQASDRALAIVQHLHLSLDMDRGREIAVELERLYSFVISKIVDGSRRLSAKDLKEAIKVLDILRSAWSELAQQEQAQSVPPELLAGRNLESRLTLHG